MSNLTKCLISADIQTLECVIELAKATGIDSREADFFERLIRLRSAFEADLVSVSKE